MTGPVINLHFLTHCIITREEYDALEREVRARVYAGDATIAERILLHVLNDNRYRRNEIAAMEEPHDNGR